MWFFAQLYMFPPCTLVSGLLILGNYSYDSIVIWCYQNVKAPNDQIDYARYLDYLSFKYLDIASLCLRRYSISWKWTPSQAGAPFCLAHSIMDYLGTNKTCNMWDTLHRSQVHAITIGVLAHTCLHTYLFNQKHQES